MCVPILLTKFRLMRKNIVKSYALLGYDKKYLYIRKIYKYAF